MAAKLNEKSLPAKVRQLFGATHAGKAQLDQFLKLLNEPVLEWLGAYANAAGAAKDLEFIAKFFIMLNRRGYSYTHILGTFIRIGKITSGRRLDAIKAAVSQTTKFSRFLDIAGKVATPIDAMLLYIDVNDAVAKGDWGRVASTIYRWGAGKLVPWVGLLDALQGLLDVAVPSQRQKTSQVFKILRACDIAGLGAAGVDSLVFFVQALIDKLKGRPFDDKRLAQIVTRLKTGPTAIFAEMGEKLPIGEFILAITSMNSADWKKLGQKQVKDLHSYVKGFF